MTDLSKMSLDQLRGRLDALNAEWYSLERAIEERALEEKKQLVQHIKDKIDAAGYGMEEIVALLDANKGATGRKIKGSYTVLVDPENAANTYVRGALPIWLKEKMRAKGYDPSSKSDRDSFKDKYLRRAAG